MLTAKSRGVHNIIASTDRLSTSVIVIRITNAIEDRWKRRTLSNNINEINLLFQ